MSNLYAQKVFSEHPISLWSFDDKVTYVSLADEADRRIDDWTLTNATASEYTDEDKLNTPFLTSYTTQIGPVNEALLNFEATSATLWSPGVLYSDISGSGDTYGDIVGTGGTYLDLYNRSIYPDVPVSASMYVYIDAPSIDYIDFGSTDGVSYEWTRNLFPDIAEKVWVKVSHNDMQYGKIYFKIVFKDTYTGTDLTYLINGLSIGQYSESVSADSLGITPVNPAGTEDVITSGALPDLDDVGWYEESSIGVEARSAYHVIRGNRLLSYNTSMPMAYGSNYLTRLRPLDPPNEGDHPSLVFDGGGMLNEQGRYDTYTLEFWLRVGGSTTGIQKIVGPAVAGNLDGLFISSNMFIISVGDSKAFYPVGKFGAPMLIHLIYTPTSLSLMINGETVAVARFDAKDLDLVADSNQWLGFWSYADLDPIEIDCLSIFGYPVPSPVAKRRFVWGQGVGELGLVNNQYQGRGVYADFSAAKMTNTVAYPSTAFWNAGELKNLDVVKNNLSVPSVVLPEVITASKDQWLIDLNTFNVDKDATLGTLDKNVYVSFKPTVDYNETINYALFSSLPKCLTNVDGVSVKWKNEAITSVVADKATTYNFLDAYTGLVDDVRGASTWSDASFVEPVFRLNNRQNSRQFIICYAVEISGDTAIKTYHFDGDTWVNISSDTAASTDDWAYSILQFSGVAETEAYSWVKSTQTVELVVGSDQQTSSALKFNSAGLFTENYFSNHMAANAAVSSSVTNGKITAIGGGYVETDLSDYEELIFTEYVWFGKQEFGHFYEDVAIRGSWVDYVPLSHLAGVVTDSEGVAGLGIDTIQYNIDFISPKILSNTNESTADEMSVTVSTDGHMIKSYVSLQDSTEWVKQAEEIATTVGLNQANTIYFQGVDDYQNKMLEVTDGAILVPPRSAAIDSLVLMLYLEFAVPGIVTNPLVVKGLQLASFAKNRNDFTKIKAKDGKDLYPIVYNGTYYDNSAINPFKVDKRGLPYLYLCSDSGFAPAGLKQDRWKKGLQFEINESLNNVTIDEADAGWKLDSLQFWIRRAKYFPTEETTFLEFTWSNQMIYFTMQSFQDDGRRGIIKAYSPGNLPYTQATFLQNGNLVASPVVDIEQWNAIQFSFAGTGLDMGGAKGNILMLPGLNYNNVSYFATKPALGSTQINYRSWDDVDEEVWDWWNEYEWAEVLVAGTAVLKTKELSQIIYKTYIGTQSISVDGLQPLRFRQDGINAYAQSSWSTTTIIPT